MNNQKTVRITALNQMVFLDGIDPLPRSFFERATATVARELLGKLLIRPGGGAAAAPDRIARIVETEAYLGVRDAASHARRGPTPRAAMMFGPAGYLYVYLIYGMHHCMNFVTETDGIAGAVLIRAAEPLSGFGDGVAPAGPLARPLAGPGKLCAGFGVTLAHKGLDLCGGALYVADCRQPAPRVKQSARIGVAYAGAWAGRRLRFYVPRNPHVSARPRD